MLDAKPAYRCSKSDSEGAADVDSDRGLSAVAYAGLCSRVLMVSIGCSRHVDNPEAAKAQTPSPNME
eukprot:scaffold18684_cov121-Isochrysis_galbana.AAC.5